MNWYTIMEQAIAEIMVAVLIGIGGWLLGIRKGKKKACLAIERKEKIYQPMINEILPYSNDNWNIMKHIEMNLLSDISENGYKYGLACELKEKCLEFYELVKEYNSFDTVHIARNIIIKIFKDAYTDIYGSIVDGIVINSDRDGNEWEEEVIAEPVKEIETGDYSNIIENLLINEGMYSGEVCIDSENNLYDCIYEQLKSIYATALHININGIENKLPKPKFRLKMTPEEYIAYNYDFFNIYNNDKRIIRKEELRKQIIKNSKDGLSTLC